MAASNPLDKALNSHPRDTHEVPYQRNTQEVLYQGDTQEVPCPVDTREVPEKVDTSVQQDPPKSLGRILPRVGRGKFRKCKSATFTLDGMSYTIGRWDVTLSEEQAHSIVHHHLRQLSVKVQSGVVILITKIPDVINSGCQQVWENFGNEKNRFSPLLDHKPLI